jgi:hypothetical protein
MKKAQPAAEYGRPLRLAIRSLRLLGVVSAAMGLYVVIVLGYLNRYTLYRRHFMALGMVAWFVPGVLYVMCAVFIGRRSRTAVIGAIVTTAGQAACAAGLLVASFLLSPVSIVPIAVCAVWVLALAELLVHLKGSLAVIRMDAEQLRGFAPIRPAGADGPRPVLPVDGNAEAAQGRWE